MKIVYYLERMSPKKVNPFIKNVETAMIHALSELTDHETHIYQASEYNIEQLKDCDVVILFGIYSANAYKATGHKLEIYQHQKKHNKGILFIEKGFIKRDHYYSLGWNSNVGFGYYHNQKMGKDRWDSLKVDLEMNNQSKKDGYILLCGQIPHDTQLQHLGKEAYVKTLQDTVNEIKKHTDRKIVFVVILRLEDED